MQSQKGGGLHTHPPPLPDIDPLIKHDHEIVLFVSYDNPQALHRVRGHFWVILLRFLHLNVLVWFLFNMPKKPERWHKASATLRRSKLLEGACFRADFMAGFAADFLADFGTDFDRRGI